MDHSRSQLSCEVWRRHVTKSAKGKSLSDFIATCQILLDGVETVDEDVAIGFLVKHDSYGNVAGHFVLQSGAVDQTDSHVVSEIHIVA